VRISVESETGISHQTKIIDLETGERLKDVYDLQLDFPMGEAVQATMKRVATDGVVVKIAKVVKSVKGYTLTCGKNTVILEFDEGAEPDWIKRLFAE